MASRSPSPRDAPEAAGPVPVGTSPDLGSEATLREPEAVARFYAERSERPAWLERDGRPGARARELLRSVEGARRHGLRPETYHASALRRRLQAPSGDAREAASLDLLLSDAFLHLARHLANGVVDPAALHPGYALAGEPSAIGPQALAAALSVGDVALALARLAPPQPEYAALMLARERWIAAGGSTDLELAERARANLERWRWLPRELGRRHLRVDTPSYLLRAFEDDEPVFAMRVVVGRVEWQTPLSDGAISHLVLNPAWQVPHSIAVREMLPAVRRDPEYFEAAGIQVLTGAEGETREVDPRSVDWTSIRPDAFPFRLRQPPGPANPLGRIKFSFRNPFGVFLHGTPGRAAFGRPQRARSHGCVRVEDEIALALFALAPDPTWTRERLLESLQTAQEAVVTLSSPLPVHLVYFSISVGPDGAARFEGDPYDWDARLLAALDRAAGDDGVVLAPPTPLGSASEAKRTGGCGDQTHPDRAGGTGGG